MSLTSETKADLLMRAIVEDRAEIRAICQNIYTICWTMTVASFAITSFLLGFHKDNAAVFTAISLPYLAAIDVAFLIMLWGLFLRLLTDLQKAQSCLEAREDLLRQLTTGEDVDGLDVFCAIAPTRRPKINHNSMYWVACTATVALILKLPAVFMIVGSLPPG